MRVMVLLKYDGATEDAAAVPPDDYMAQMRDYNSELHKAGVLLAAEGLHTSSHGVRVRFASGRTSVIDGPFTEAKELIAGFYLFQVGSLDEAIEWVKRCPMPNDDAVEIEIREVYESPDS